MKVDMMVVGLEAKTDELMEIKLVPLVNKRKKLTIGDIAGDLDQDAKQLIDLFLQDKQYRSIIYMTREWCSSNNVIPFSHLTVDIDIGSLHKERFR